MRSIQFMQSTCMDLILCRYGVRCHVVQDSAVVVAMVPEDVVDMEVGVVVIFEAIVISLRMRYLHQHLHQHQHHRKPLPPPRGMHLRLRMLRQRHRFLHLKLAATLPTQRVVDVVVVVK
jgi:hypothetical protein